MDVLQFILSGLSNGSIYAIVGMGFVIVYDITHVMNFCQGEFVMLGGMLTVMLSGYGLPMSLSIVLAIFITSLLGAVIYRVIIYPVRRASVVTLILITFGLAIIIRGGAVLIWGTDSQMLPPFSQGSPLNVLGAVVPLQGLWVIGVTIALVVALSLFFQHTLLGKATRACAINPVAASCVGVKVENMGLLSFTLAGAMGAMAGVIVTPLTLTSATIGLPLAIMGFIAALIGGVNSPVGILVAGLALGILQSLSAGLISSGFKEVIALVIFLAVLSFRRTGLFGEAETGRI